MKKPKKRKFKRSGKFWVYMLLCSNGAYYTGSTNDLENRFTLHSNGKGAKYTRDRRPLRLVLCREFSCFRKAFSAEFEIKQLTRKKKERLIEQG